MIVYLAEIGSRPYVIDGDILGRGKWKERYHTENRGGEMLIYAAGGISGNNAREWKEIANRGGYEDESLLCRRASCEERGNSLAMGGHQILESFYYCRKNDYIPKLLPLVDNFLLDSGAFTFMQGKGAVDWDAYLEEYAAFINKYDIELFFELDIDSIVGLPEVERLRYKLEKLTGKKPIPVWHISRGWDYFVKMCKNYPYVAFGGLMTDGVDRKKIEKAFPKFINTAHSYGAKIHGLGYTSIANLKKYHFDSVDSTAWLYGNRAGYLYKFNPRTGLMDKIEAPKGHRLKSTEAALHNYREWMKFQQYAKKYL